MYFNSLVMGLLAFLAYIIVFSIWANREVYKIEQSNKNKSRTSLKRNTKYLNKEVE